MASMREPAVAGRFYPADAGETARRGGFLSFPTTRTAASHRLYCSARRLHLFRDKLPGRYFPGSRFRPRCIVLCPNHTGLGHPLAIMKEGAWRTPLGEMPIDSELAEKLLQAFPALVEDSAAHRSEHAIEVELPFLQVSEPGVKFVPIAVGTGQLAAAGASWAKPWQLCLGLASGRY